MSRLSLPLVSLDTLHDLEASLDGEATLCRGFVRTYVDMWSPRYERLCCAVVAKDPEAAMDAALSLCTSSYMVGAQRLGHLAEEFIDILKSGTSASAMRALPSLGRCGEQTVCALVSEYICPEHGS
ncbi:MAG: Hpt domain-containing protein [Specibacter sp.]